MAIELKMPALSPTMEEGTLARWLVKVGDSISSGDIMAEIETDKATMEFEAVDEGVLAAIVVGDGTENVAVGTVIAMLAEEGEDVSDVSAPSGESAPAKAEEPAPAPTPAPTPAPAPAPAVSSDDGPKASPLANAAGWVEVDPATLQHKRFENVFGLGDVTDTPNAKTAAAARKQAPIVAENVLARMRGAPLKPLYDGYGSCPLTVERGKIILAEFGYGGTLMPSFPWDSTVPRRSAWYLKKDILPWLYWNGLLKGREWLTATTKN